GAEAAGRHRAARECTLAPGAGAHRLPVRGDGHAAERFRRAVVVRLHGGRLSATPAGGRWLAARSLLWTILLPGIQSFALPWFFFGLREARLDFTRATTWLGLAAIGVGAG